ncbi:MAG: class I SAM-dependent rRNA methyltransferase [Rikenellaceae bacterium]|nr:class I SAM-dependent rRNA methyltransferase [Rikenellaceae bacterium]
MIKVYLKRSREESVKRFHPWIFSGAIQKIEGVAEDGAMAALYSSEGKVLGVGHYQIGSIAVRVLEFQTDSLPENFWEKRIEAAYRLRSILGLTGNNSTTAYRLVHGEGDMLPGLIIDIYNGTAVIQAHSAGMFLAREEIATALKKVYGKKLDAVYDKSALTAPFKAGLQLSDGYIFGKETHPASIIENGVRFLVDWCSGQKTGFFLDQRDNRELVGKYSNGKNLLNLFCYTGGFSLYALTSGAASVTSVDSSRTAMEMLEKNIGLNIESGIVRKDARHNSVCDDAIEYLKRGEKGQYDVIVVDPPAFAKHRAAIPNALRAYQRLNAAALDKVAFGGIVFTFSCSQSVDKTAFAEAIFSAAAQTGRKVRILHRLTQPADHPVNIYHPEGEYLKGLVLYVE